MCCLGPWALLPMLSILALAYFICRDMHGDIFETRTEEILNRVGIDIFLSTGLWALFVITHIGLFMELLPLAFVPHACLLTRLKKHAIVQASEDCWLCPNCETENHNVRVRCSLCDREKPAPAGPDPKQAP